MAGELRIAEAVELRQVGGKDRFTPVAASEFRIYEIAYFFGILSRKMRKEAGFWNKIWQIKLHNRSKSVSFDTIIQ